MPTMNFVADMDVRPLDHANSSVYQSSTEFFE